MGFRSRIPVMLVQTNDTGGDSITPTQIEVDLRGLQDFAALLNDELEANLRPIKERIVADHIRGVGFGLNHASIDMHLAVQKYQDCLTAAVSNLDAYVQAAEVLISAAHKVTMAYQTADELTAARLADVTEALNTAISEATAIQEAAPQVAVEQKVTRMERQGLL
jgi:hypothetical protein